MAAMTAPTSLYLTAAAVAVLSAISVRCVRAFALKKALLDMPNDRSSHKVPVPRLGGAAFIPVVLLGLAAAWWRGGPPMWFTAGFFVGAILLFAISLLDDFISLSAKSRFAGQILAVICVVAPGLHYSGAVTWPYVLLVGAIYVFFATGLVNIYNFMDGIDGIAGIQAISAGLFWFAVSLSHGAPGTGALALLVVAGAVGFLTLNWPPAKIFMGDAGSTVLGYTFAALPLLAVIESRGSLNLSTACVAGFFAVWPFLLDGAFTILRRLRKGENIFQAHRSHLYQRLVIAGRPHARVTLAYGALAAVGAALGACVVRGTFIVWAGSAAVVGLLFLALWRWTLAEEVKAKRAT